MVQFTRNPSLGLCITQPTYIHQKTIVQPTTISFLTIVHKNQTRDLNYDTNYWIKRLTLDQKL